MLEQWSVFVDQKQRNKLLIQRSLQKIAHRQLHCVLEQWSVFVNQRVHLRVFLHRIRTHHLHKSMHAWSDFLGSKRCVKKLLTSIVHVYAHKSLRSGWKQWLQSDVKIQLNLLSIRAEEKQILEKSAYEQNLIELKSSMQLAAKGAVAETVVVEEKKRRNSVKEIMSDQRRTLAMRTIKQMRNFMGKRTFDHIKWYFSTWKVAALVKKVLTHQQ